MTQRDGQFNLQTIYNYYKFLMCNTISFSQVWDSSPQAMQFSHQHFSFISTSDRIALKKTRINLIMGILCCRKSQEVDLEPSVEIRQKEGVTEETSVSYKKRNSNRVTQEVSHRMHYIKNNLKSQSLFSLLIPC